MFRVATTLIFILASSATLGSRPRAMYQDPKYPPEYPCVVPLVECPETYDRNSDIVFHAYAPYPISEYKIKYRWTVWWARGVRKGRIKSGQETDTLVVSARHGKVIGIVRIIGAPKECPQTASCTTMPVVTVK